ncbi:hypothetical protein BX600DRAFT_440255 [Xylariales sp. PMI_506]|nr:hypothetical protein BX600DRAFT_440255 [Xylariales sp. PMI_506]
MAELLGTGASAVGIASFAVELGSVIRKLVNFCRDVLEAPQEVLFLLEDIELLVEIVENLERDFRTTSTKLRLSHNTIISRCARRCFSIANELALIASDVERDVNRKPIWKSMKFVLKEKTVKKLQRKLESSKISLFLAIQLDYHTVWEMALIDEELSGWELIGDEEIGSDADTLDRTLRQHNTHIPIEKQPDPRSLIDGTAKSRVQISKNEDAQQVGSSRFPQAPVLPGSCRPRSSTEKENTEQAKKSQPLRRITRSSAKFLVGLLKYQEISVADVDSTPETASSELVEKALFLDLPSWLWPHRYLVHQKRAMGGWDWKLRTYNVVPLGSPVFVLCANGDSANLQDMFNSKRASPFDIDPEGNTLLHASGFAHIDICRVLVDCGLAGDIQPNNIHSDRSPLHSLAWFSRDLSAASREKQYRQIFHHSPDKPREQVTMDEVQALMRLLMDRGRFDPMEIDHKGGTVVSTYVGPPDIFVDTFIADANQPDDPGAAALIQVASKRYSNVTSIVSSMLRTGIIDESIAKYKDRTGYTLLHALCWRTRHYWLPEYPYRQHDNHPLHPIHARNPVENIAWRRMLEDTVKHGADLNAQCMLWQDLRTPLDYMIAGFSRTEAFSLPLARYIRGFVRSWLTLLISAGVDIELYGRRELECRQELSRSDGHSWARLPGWDVLEIRFGGSPDDFNIIWSGNINQSSDDDS